MSRNLYILGVDPGNRSGAVLLDFSGGVRGKWGLGAKDAPTNGSDVFEVCLEANRIADDDGCTVILAVEAQFIPGAAGYGQNRRAHAVDALKVASHAGGWKSVAQLCGWHVWGEPIHPNKWRQGVYGGHKIVKAEEYSTWAIEAFWNEFGLFNKDEHVAEAGLIALWTIGRVKEYGVL